METEKLNRYIFISSALIFVISIVGFILLGVNYLTVSTKYGSSLINGTSYNGYSLIGDKSITNASFEPVLHLMGFIFFLLGSVIFLVILCNNKYNAKKKINLENKTALNNKTLTILQIVCSILFAAAAILIFVYGFLVSPTPSNQYVYSIGGAKTFNAILLGINFVVLTVALNLELNLLKK